MKKEWDAQKTNNTHDCCRYNTEGTPIKKNGSAGKSHSKERKPEGVNFAQIFRTELRKALRKNLAGARDIAAKTRKVTATPTIVREGSGRIALGNYIHVRKLN